VPKVREARTQRRPYAAGEERNRLLVLPVPPVVAVGAAADRSATRARLCAREIACAGTAAVEGYDQRRLQAAIAIVLC
jgi:hypothetical protein